MIDTLVLRTTAAVALPCAPGNTRDEFSFHSLTAEFLTTEPKSQFRKEGSRWMVQMHAES